MGTEAGTGNDDRKGRRTMALSLISLHGPSLSLPFISWSLCARHVDIHRAEDLRMEVAEVFVLRGV